MKEELMKLSLPELHKILLQNLYYGKQQPFSMDLNARESNGKEGKVVRSFTVCETN